MPSTYWWNQGLGVKLEEIHDLLDAEKTRAYLAQIGAFAKNGLRNPGRLKGYRRASNRERIDYLTAAVESLSNDGLCGVLAHADAAERNLLCSANDGDGVYYLLYPPFYPWDLKETDCRTKAEAEAYICDLLMRFTRSEVTREKVLERIEYINEVGISG